MSRERILKEAGLNPEGKSQDEIRLMWLLFCIKRGIEAYDQEFEDILRASPLWGDPLAQEALAQVLPNFNRVSGGIEDLLNLISNKEAA